MENTTLYAQKVTILSRLIKESSLTLEEALVLLKEEETEVVTPPTTFIPGTSDFWTVPYPTVFSGTISSSGISDTSFTVTNTAAEPDLNN